MEWIGLGLLILALLVYIVALFNQIIRFRVKILEAHANIDVALSKRYHVLTQLFEVAKGYAKYERETLLDVIAVRQNMSIAEKEETDRLIRDGFDRLLVLQEAYPRLKADELFLNLQDAARDAEEHLQAARRLYNSNVSIYNQRIQTFPGSLIAHQMETKHYEMFQKDSKEANTVDIDF